MLPFPDPRNVPERSLFCGEYELNPSPPKPNSSTTSFFPFSPPLFNPDSLHELLAAHLLPLPAGTAIAAADIPLPPRPPDPVLINSSIATVVAPPKGNSAGGSCSTPRRRAARKDRHSKIYTATGPRDRRMRLSLEVARKFFDLQDMLGFDKASKTVQWLFTMSKAAIKEVAAGSSSDVRFFSEGSGKCQSSTSECEDVSTVSDNKGKSALLAAAAEDTKTPKAKRGSKRAPRKATFHPLLARESRAKARARARERTRAKKKIRCGFTPNDDGEGNHWASSSAPFDAIEEESGSQSFKSSLALAAEAEERCFSSPRQCMKPATERACEFPMACSGSGPIPAFQVYSENITGINDAVGVFQEQWDMERALMANAQFQSRQWEAYGYSPIE